MSQSISTSAKMSLTSLQKLTGNYFQKRKFVLNQDIFRDRVALWFTSKEPEKELKLSFQELSLASQKAANAIASLEVKKAICILPKVIKSKGFGI